jgi:hypothetical protein
MVRGAAINVTPLAIFGLFSVPNSCQKFRAYRQVCTDRNCLCYNSVSGQGQLLWLVFACSAVLDGGLAWCPWCPLTSEFGSMGLKRATQAKRLNVRKANKYAGFR